jgi:hypothetical protein
LRVLTRRVNGVFGVTWRGAWVMRSEALLPALATSPNSVETQRLPSWKPLCASRSLSTHVSVRIACPLTTLPAPLPEGRSPSAALEMVVNATAAPSAAITAPTASSRLLPPVGSAARR